MGALNSIEKGKNLRRNTKWIIYKAIVQSVYKIWGGGMGFQ